MSPIAGFTRLRAHQVAKQTVIATAVPATRRRPTRGPIVVNPNRTQADVDEGSLDPIGTPYSLSREVTSSQTCPAAFDELPVTFAAALKGGVAAVGGAAPYTWTYQLASLTADSFDYFTDEWGDDQSASDGIRAHGGVIDSFEMGFGEDLGPWELSEEWIYADGVVPYPLTGGLTVDSSPAWVYGGDTEFYLDSAPGSIGISLWTDAIHGIRWRVRNNLDKKRFANGSNASNSRFQLSGYGRGQREIEYEILTAKTAQSMAEAATIDDEPVADRYLRAMITSGEIAGGVTPYSLDIRSPVRLFSKEDTEIGGNSCIRLVYRAFYEPDTLAYALKAVLVNANPALP
jgi:hypothetical protein